MTKRVLSVIIACFVLIAFAGCSQQAPSSSSTQQSATSATAASAAPKAPVELSVWIGSWWDQKAPDIKKEFEKAYPQYKVKIDCLPINGYFDNAASAIMAGSPPDVLDLDVTQVSTFAAKNLLTDLTADVESKLKGDDFIKGAWQASHYNGKLYGMPSRASGATYYYNKKMFDDAKVPYPKEGWTYDDLLDAAKKITVPGQKYGVGIAADLSDPSNVMTSFSPVLWANGGDYLNSDNTKCTMDQPNAIKAITFWTELYTKYKVVPEGSLNYTISRDVVPLLANNQVAMLPFGVSGIDTFSKTPGLQWDIVIPPSGFNRGGGWTLTVPVSAKHKKEANDYLLWFAKPEVQAPLCATEPSVISAWKLNAPWNTPMYQTVLKAAMTGKLLPSIGKWGEAQTIIIKELQKTLQGAQTPEQAGKNMTVQIDPLLK